MDASATSIYPSLTNKTVLITGGGSGIGAAFTRAFAERGSRVAFVDVAQETSEALVDELNAEGATKPLFLACDVRDIEALRFHRNGASPTGRNQRVDQQCRQR